MSVYIETLFWISTPIHMGKLYYCVWHAVRNMIIIWTDWTHKHKQDNTETCVPIIPSAVFSHSPQVGIHYKSKNTWTLLSSSLLVHRGCFHQTHWQNVSLVIVCLMCALAHSQWKIVSQHLPSLLFLLQKAVLVTFILLS